MRPDCALSRLLRAALIVVALTAAVVFALRSLGAKPAALRAAEERLDSAERERNAAAAHVVVVVARAAEANAATKPALARVESLRARVRIAGSGQLQVQNGDAAEPTPVTVPPLVTERLEADSVAISALTVALTWDSRAMAAQEEQLVAEAKARDVARLTITQLERERRPRCGRSCGIVLGAVSVAALAIAVR